LTEKKRKIPSLRIEPKRRHINDLRWLLTVNGVKADGWNDMIGKKNFMAIDFVNK
jgi:hypothetical protein